MPIRRRAVLGLIAASALVPARAVAQDRLPVVASVSILGDLVARVGGDRVAVTVLVGPDGDAHVFQPSPADARAVAGARAVVVNGLGFEPWLDRLIEAAGYAGPVIVASRDVTPLALARGEADDPDHAADDHGPADPHAWQDVANARLYVAAIAEGLAAADPGGAATYRANAAAYGAELDALDAAIRAAVAALPPDRRRIVTSHDAFAYFARAYGVTFVAPQGMSTEAEASAADVAALIAQVRAEGTPALFLENVSDPRLLDRIAAETGAAIGGTLYSDALSGPEGPAASYLAMMRHNIATLTAALGD